MTQAAIESRQADANAALLPADALPVGERILVSSGPDVRSGGHSDHAELVTQHWRSWGGVVAAGALVGAGALIFDAMTPETVSVGIFYVGLVPSVSELSG